MSRYLRGVYPMWQHCARHGRGLSIYVTRVPGRQLVTAEASSVRVPMVKLFHSFISSHPQVDSVNPQLTNEKVQAWRSQASYPRSDN